ncbi:unnamed protein product [Chondrus crispus]|uniref:Uncharacterized protein n=1 Tax=Chondrus crispus TaxID=2769 RepID=R7QM10_CHOCR|nr:unnamed protein product [Chondrus crispus]CDF39139.1 unnamed protein product [Chondrus crispus]|eukprot:XP_005719050.1 unnamed protein product [Chondrus crispus]
MHANSTALQNKVPLSQGRQRVRRVPYLLRTCLSSLLPPPLRRKSLASTETSKAVGLHHTKRDESISIVYPTYSSSTRAYVPCISHAHGTGAIASP